MDGPNNIHELVGNIAKALKNANLPRPSALINIEEDNFSNAATNRCKNRTIDNNLSSINAFSHVNYNVLSPDVNPSVCEITSVQTNPDQTVNSHSDLNKSSNDPYTIFQNNYDAQNNSTSVHHLDESDRRQDSNLQAPCTTTGQHQVLIEPDSLLKLLSNETDADVFPHTSIEYTSEKDVLTNKNRNDNVLNYQSVSAKGVMLRIPDYVKVPAKIFPVIIGTETYILPYYDNNTTIVLGMNVKLAAGQYVVAKVVGCGSLDPNTSLYPEGIILTLQDEIKFLQAKSTSEMTVNEQIQFREMKKRQDEAIARSIDKFNRSQIQNKVQLENKDTKAADAKAILNMNHILMSQSMDNSLPTEVNEQKRTNCLNETEYLSVSADLVGTVVRIPESNETGLISYEINDGFVTAPFSTVPSLMVGGETVTFDLDMNRKTKKKEAVRIKLAPLGANLKNSKDPKTNSRKNKPKNSNSRKPNLKLSEKKLPLIKNPVTIFSTQKFSKLGMFGTIMRLPTKNVDGVVKFYTDNSYSRAEFPTQDEAAPKLQLHVNDFVQFDLDVWFNPIYPFEAKNIKVADKKRVLGHYSSENFICDGLISSKKPWTLLDFRHLMTILRDSNIAENIGGTNKKCCGTKKAYDWKTISQQMKKSQHDIHIFLGVFILKLDKSVDFDPSTDKLSRRDLNNFIKNLTKLKDGSETAIDIENIPMSKVRPIKPLHFQKQNGTLAHEEPPSLPRKTPVKPNKRAKSGHSKSEVSAVESLTSVEASTSNETTGIPASFTPHQTFVAKNLLTWQQIPEVAGEHAVNSVLGDVMAACAEHVATSGNNVTTSSNHVTTSGNHVTTSGNHVRTSSNHVTTSGSNVTTSDNHVTTSGSNVTTSDNHETTSVDHVTTSGDLAALSGENTTSSAQHVDSTSSSQAEQPDYGKLYNYIGFLLGSEQPNAKLPNLSEQEAQIILFLVQELFEDISKRNLHTHKQFLLQRFFDFTGGKSSGRTPINPYKLKGFLLHLPNKRKNLE